MNIRDIMTRSLLQIRNVHHTRVSARINDGNFEERVHGFPREYYGDETATLRRPPGPADDDTDFGRRNVAGFITEVARVETRELCLQQLNREKMSSRIKRVNVLLCASPDVSVTQEWFK